MIIEYSCTEYTNSINNTCNIDINVDSTNKFKRDSSKIMPKLETNKTSNNVKYISKNRNKVVKDGLYWMLSIIDKNYNQINKQIVQDISQRDSVQQQKVCDQELRVQQWKQEEEEEEQEQGEEQDIQQQKHVKQEKYQTQEKHMNNQQGPGDENETEINVTQTAASVDKRDEWHVKHVPNSNIPIDFSVDVENESDGQVGNSPAVPYNPIGHLLNENDINTNDDSNENGGNQSPLIINDNNLGDIDNKNNDIQSILDDIENQVNTMK